MLFRSSGQQAGELSKTSGILPGLRAQTLGFRACQGGIVLLSSPTISIIFHKIDSRENCTSKTTIHCKTGVGKNLLHPHTHAYTPRAQPPAFPHNSRGRLGFPGPTQPLGGTRHVGGLLGVAGRLSGTVSLKNPAADAGGAGDPGFIPDSGGFP